MSSFEQNNNDLSLADIHHEVLLQLEAIIFASVCDFIITVISVI